MPRGRTTTAPKKPCTFYLEDRQIAALRAVAKLAPDGTPSLASMIRVAIDEFLESRVSRNPALKEEIARQLGARTLTPIRGGKTER